MFVQRELFYFENDELFLLLNDLTHTRVVDCGVHMALHHGASLIILDVALPPVGAHPAVFTEPLLPEITQG